MHCGVVFHNGNFLAFQIGKHLCIGEKRQGKLVSIVIKMIVEVLKRAAVPAARLLHDTPAARQSCQADGMYLLVWCYANDEAAYS